MKIVMLVWYDEHEMIMIYEETSCSEKSLSELNHERRELSQKQKAYHDILIKVERSKEKR